MAFGCLFYFAFKIGVLLIYAHVRYRKCTTTVTHENPIR